MPDGNELARINTQIEKAKARLSELYAKRRAMIAASKPPKRIGFKARIKQVSELALAGADMPTIVEKVRLSESTIRYYLWVALSDELSEEDGDYAEREFELKKRLYPGIKWRKGGNYKVGSDLMRPVRYVFNDGTVRYMIGTQEAQGPFKE